MTIEQKNKIVSMRKAGYGYTAVAREVGLSKSAISNFCRENGIAGKGNIVEETGKNELICAPNRVILCADKKARSLEKQGAAAFRVTTIFADKPNEEAVAEALRILVNVR